MLTLDWHENQRHFWILLSKMTWLCTFNIQFLSWKRIFAAGIKQLHEKIFQKHHCHTCFLVMVIMHGLCALADVIYGTGYVEQ